MAETKIIYDGEMVLKANQIRSTINNMALSDAMSVLCNVLASLVVAFDLNEDTLHHNIDTTIEFVKKYPANWSAETVFH